MKTIFTYVLFISLLFSFNACGKKTDTQKEPTKDSSTTKITPDSGTNNQVNNQPEITNVPVSDEVVKDPNSSPEAVVKTMIKAGKTGNYGPLLKLCNQIIEMDGDAKDVCGIATASKDDQEEFNNYFGNAKIVGSVRVHGNMAEVDIETTAEGGDKETIVVQQKYNKWYLQGF